MLAWPSLFKWPHELIRQLGNQIFLGYSSVSGVYQVDSQDSLGAISVLFSLIYGL